MYDVLIIGGGVSGTALLYTLSNFTNIQSVILLEKHQSAGLVNSKSTNNSQTLHFGDIETNYSLSKASKVKQKADMLKNFLDEYGSQNIQPPIFKIYNKMIMAVGEKEVEELEKRYIDFITLFPLLRRVEYDEIAKLEPLVVQGRDPHEKILALVSPEGYTVDYGALSQVFIEKSLISGKETKKTVDVCFNTHVTKVTKIKDGYEIYTQSGMIYYCKVLIVSAGGYTPLIAQSLGYAKNYSILSVAGSFFKSTRKILNGKVYTMQIPKLPFAAIHGDPDVYNSDETRFGPTAKGIFMLERYNYKSILDYFRIFGRRRKAFQIIFFLAIDSIIGPYLFKNFWYDMPWIGKRLFIKEIKKIIPTIKAEDIVHSYHLGGTRPQILNLDTMSLEMGEAKIIGDRIIFNITPSPGATTCLGNAYEDIKTIVGWLKIEDPSLYFDQETFTKKYSTS